MKYKALVLAEMLNSSLLEAFADKIEFVFDGYNLNHEVMPHDELLAKIADYDILISEYDTIGRDVLEKAEKLKLIICCRGGVKSVIDLEAAKEKGVIICNNAGRNANAVADLVMGYIICMTRNIVNSTNDIFNKVITSDVSTKPGEYQDTIWGLNNDSPFIKYRGKSINYMTLGLVGFGCVGKLVAKRASAFDMKVVAYDPYIDKSNVPENVELVDFDTLLEKSDIVSLHCVVTPETKNMFNEATFAKMKQGSYIINSARGGLLVEADLVDALNSGKLAGAALDVTQQEPIPSNSNLLTAKNLIITPHIAGSSYDVQVCGTRMVCEALEDWLNDVKPRNCVVYNK